MRARFIRNRRLYDAASQWALCSLQGSPGCRAFYDRRRAAGWFDKLEPLANRLGSPQPRKGLLVGQARANEGGVEGADQSGDLTLSSRLERSTLGLVAFSEIKSR